MQSQNARNERNEFVAANKTADAVSIVTAMALITVRPSHAHSFDDFLVPNSWPGRRALFLGRS